MQIEYITKLKNNITKMFYIYDIKNIDLILSNKLLRFKYLVFGYKRKYFKDHERNWS